MTTYDYAQGDLLEQRNTYTYTEYGGRAFLDAWRASRAEALATLPEPAAVAPDARATGELSGDRIETGDALEIVMAGLEAGEAHSVLEALLQRFEVSKRLHARYSSRWRPVDPRDYADLSRYVRFAETLDRAYERLGDLRYLSALLKCIDTLVALRSRLDGGQAARVARLVVAEREHVRRLEQGPA